MNYHIIGIAGHTMNGVALALRTLGAAVTGTDESAYPPVSDRLDELGFTWWRQADSSHLDGVDEVIVGGGIAPNHPEVVAALDLRIPIKSYPEVVGELTKQARRIVVSGTHGKTTTTSLLAWLFETAGRRPDFLIGITPKNFTSSVRMAGSDVAILEGDEYRASQLETKSKFDYYDPDVLMITSIEMDHPDFFRDEDDIEQRFEQLILNMPKDSKVFYNTEVPSSVSKTGGEWRVPYCGDPNWRDVDGWHVGKRVDYTPEGLRFSVFDHDHNYGRVEIGLYGIHNVDNVLGAVAVAISEGLQFDQIQRALLDFRGAARRFELASNQQASVRVIDDYAHHPTEVATTINAAKRHFNGRVLAIFRPHTYSRTLTLLKEYQQAFKEADIAFLAPIEGAREGSAKTVSSHDIAAKAGDWVTAFDDRESLVEAVMAAVQPGDTVLCMTVNGYDGLAEELASRTGKL